MSGWQEAALDSAVHDPLNLGDIPIVDLNSIWNDPDECAIRYEDDDGFTVHEGECYAHLATDPKCLFQEPQRLAAFLERCNILDGDV